MALTYMRLGEQENCQDRHTHESCIAPIKGTGIHLKREGSEQGIFLLFPFSLLSLSLPLSLVFLLSHLLADLQS
jgi:hypothetical protein